jgi:anaerobic magnesium-protoporphyrin IX monomethyl ester cyclase
MNVALLNPNWRFEGSIYFGCREPHLPLEYGYARQLLKRQGHNVLLIDGHMERLTNEQIRARLLEFDADFSIVTTAPSYLSWRCAPPELRQPKSLLNAVRDIAGVSIVIGPHVSTTPSSALLKLRADVGIIGEPEEILTRLIRIPPARWGELPSICYHHDRQVIIQGPPHQSDMSTLPVLEWPEEMIRRHQHHHHRFDLAPQGPAAEMEVSRGCDRKRPIRTILGEMDRLIDSGARYIYFIDEVFLPDHELLTSIADRRIQFGVHTRIDHWQPSMIDLLGRAGCVSVEAGVESISEDGTSRLVYAKRRVAFVQANLLDGKVDDDDAFKTWRERLATHGVWASRPEPLFPYPGSSEYTHMWGRPDDFAWERAHEYYLHAYSKFSDGRNERPLPLAELENVA